MSTDGYREVALPKWPQMRVSGRSVSIEQAKDIIFRTDEFLTSVDRFMGGNNHEFNFDYRKKAGLTPECESHEDRYYYTWCNSDAAFELEERVQEHFKVLKFEYVVNDYASTCYVGGGHGWCWPDGRIYHSKNVGKWPSQRELLNEWQQIASAFPYLVLNATFMSGEYAEKNIVPLFNIHVSHGEASLDEPNLSVHGSIVFDHENETEDVFEQRLNNSMFGIDLPLDWYEEYAQRVNTFTSLLHNKSQQ